MSVPPTVSHDVQQMQVWLKLFCDSGGYADEAEVRPHLNVKQTRAAFGPKLNSDPLQAQCLGSTPMLQIC